MDLGQPSIWGTDENCDFFYESCLVDEVPISDEFCTDTDPWIMCDYHHLNKSYCYIGYYSSDIPNEEDQYFEDPKKGSYSVTDYCPVPRPYSDGSCRYLESFTN